MIPPFSNDFAAGFIAGSITVTAIFWLVLLLASFLYRRK